VTVPPWIILCPGQGAQAIGMGRAWCETSPEARSVMDRADALLGSRLGIPLSELCWNGPVERLNQTDASQPAIFACSMVCWSGWLARQAIAPTDMARLLVATAGLSLGEYTALTIAGAMSFEDGLELVTLRGRAMQEAAQSPESLAGGGGAMLALIGATDEQAEEVCGAARGSRVLVCANFNAPGQVVLSGHKEACERGAQEATKMGLRSSMLAVAGAFHSPLMAPAADRLRAALEKTTIRAPSCPVLANVTGRLYSEGGTRESGAGEGGAVGVTPELVRRRLVEQLTRPVRWSQGCAWLAGNLKGEFHELAPGRTLSGLMRRIDKNVKVINHEEP
jgi:[acyl-carrier-protein] S-malonyltransferase